MTVVQMSDRVEPGAEIEQRSPAGTLISKIQRDDAIREQIAMALPATVSLDRFARATSTALLQNPDLAKSDETALFQAVVKCAQDGLLPDGREAALVLYKGKAQYLPMIGGVRKIAAEYGWTIRTHVVYANDEFAVEQGTDDKILHRPAPIGADRGDLVAAYAIAHHRDGRRSFFEVMTGEDVAKAKAVAQTDRVWKQWPAQMWEKTVGHRIAKKLPLDPVDAQRLSRVIEASEVTPGAAAVALYGPGAGASFSELPSGVQSGPQPADDVTDVPTSVGDTPGSGGSAADEPLAGTAGATAAATPTDEDDEPVVVLEPKPDEATLEEATLEERANAAAMFIPPNGQFAQGGDLGPKSLSEILALGEQGEKWLRWALGKVTTPQDYVDSVWAFTAVYAPELHAAATKRKAA